MHYRMRGVITIVGAGNLHARHSRLHPRLRHRRCTSRPRLLPHGRWLNCLRERRSGRANRVRCGRPMRNIKAAGTWPVNRADGSPAGALWLCP